MDFLRRLLGRGQQAASEKMDQAKRGASSGTDSMNRAESATRDTAERVPGMGDAPPPAPAPPADTPPNPRQNPPA